MKIELPKNRQDKIFLKLLRNQLDKLASQESQIKLVCRKIKDENGYKSRTIVLLHLLLKFYNLDNIDGALKQAKKDLEIKTRSSFLKEIVGFDKLEEFKKRKVRKKTTS